jgi:hypothetical protein
MTWPLSTAFLRAEGLRVAMANEVVGEGEWVHVASPTTPEQTSGT